MVHPGEEDVPDGEHDELEQHRLSDRSVSGGGRVDFGGVRKGLVGQLQDLLQHGSVEPELVVVVVAALEELELHPALFPLLALVAEAPSGNDEEEEEDEGEQHW